MSIKSNEQVNSSAQHVGDDSIDHLVKEAGRYIPPHERRKLAERQTSPPPTSKPAGGRPGGWGGERSRSPPGGGGSKWSGDKGPDFGGGASRGGGGGGGGFFDRQSTGGSKWSGGSGGGGFGGHGRKEEYGPDGLLSRNPRLEEELFAHVSTGINFDKYEDIEVRPPRPCPALSPPLYARCCLLCVSLSASRSYGAILACSESPAATRPARLAPFAPWCSSLIP